jgi:hypothetical protein
MLVQFGKFGLMKYSDAPETEFAMAMLSQLSPCLVTIVLLLKQVPGCVPLF